MQPARRRLAHPRVFPHDAMTRWVCSPTIMVRAGLRTILETDKAIEVVGEANDGQEAVTLTQALDLTWS